jgi:hypothetical protein
MVTNVEKCDTRRHRAGDTAISDLTTDLLSAFVAATPDQKARALRLLRGESADRFPSPEPYLTLKELGTRLHLHPATLWRWGVPKLELAGRPRFKISDVTAYLESPEFKLRVSALRLARKSRRTAK